MFARLTVYETVDVALSDKAREWLETSGADPFRELPGYRGSMTLLDRDNARIIGVGFYATAADAAEAARRLPALYADAVGQVPDSLRPILDMSAKRVDLYEIVHRD